MEIGLFLLGLTIVGAALIVGAAIEAASDKIAESNESIIQSLDSIAESIDDLANAFDGDDEPDDPAKEDAPETNVVPIKATGTSEIAARRML